MLSHLELLAEYNQWMNRNLYESASSLSPEQLNQDCGAFFGSVLATLNHIMVGDLIWLGRIASHCQSSKPAASRSVESRAAASGMLDWVSEYPKPSGLKDVLFDDFSSLRRARESLDQELVNFSQQLTPEFLASDLVYTSTRGDTYSKNMGHILVHLFNHQTHHRGQVTTLLNQLGADVGVTDLLMCIPDSRAKVEPV